MNWRLPGGLLLASALLVSLDALEHGYEAIRFRLYATELSGRVIVSDVHYTAVQYQGPKGPDLLFGPATRYSSKGHDVPVLQPNADTPAQRSAMLKSEWSLLQGRHILVIPLWLFGIALWRRHRVEASDGD